MKYALGNMLNGAGGLNPDGLSLDLQFAADKTLTARKGPTPVLTRASSGTFVGSNGLIQSAAINAARFDHDPVTLACKGLLIEESRANLVNHSEDFSNLYWNSFATASAAQISQTTPSGGSTSSRLTAIAGTSTTRQRIVVQAISSGSTITTFSCFIKAGTSNFGLVSLAFNKVGVGGIRNCDAHIVFSTGVITKTGVSNADFTVSSTPYPNGWYRISISATSNASTAIEDQVVGSQGISFNGAGGSGSFAGTETVFAWGAQREAGSFPTSYIPTTTASVIRSADVCSITGSAFTGFWNQTSGTLVEAFEASPNTNTTYVSASNGNIVQNSVHLDNDTGLMRAVYYSGSSLVATLDLGSVGTVGTVNTIATAYSVNDFSASRNGGTVVTDTSGAVPASLSQMNIGADERSQTPTSFYSNRCIKSLRYYKKRLGNAKLQTLST